MVLDSVISASNARLPNTLVAVFVGGTSGIGEYTLKSFARHCPNPRAYFIGRSQPSADRIVSELKKLNPKGTYTFIKSDVGEIKNVDAVCAQIRSKEQSINMLVLSQGTMIAGVETSEGLHLAASLIIHSRTRFIVNLLPQLQAATTLRRVVSIFTGTKEGPITNPDFQMRSMGYNVLKARGQAASTVTLAMETVAATAPDVSFIHDFPGPVNSNIARGDGVARLIMRGISRVVSPFLCIKEDVSGDRHLFLATSARYPSVSGAAEGVEKGNGVEVARGIDGKVGSGMYVVDEVCEPASKEVESLMRKLKEDGWDKKIWEHVVGEFVRITRKERI
jgi:NAD(P)-dependent dehydrogenase (short-subunit alcohol dehydrogenase family)